MTVHLATQVPDHEGNTVDVHIAADDATEALDAYKCIVRGLEKEGDDD